ncbi:carboxypeptidase M32 [Microvirga splendida]|uniref:Metal-dependent carboxypeptidase n=1 Tax=Microvirga splendida TaxID=2795727 RepID=A0ABS0Y5Z6_9HYPH|nr:carboxypeptidase M32 [Microvirga splendida]MBJ6127718.1 carboxypeptidase M32 [Microvirga splendida]
MQVYRSLEERFARISSIEDAIGILQWDAETLMPEGAADSRSDQLATLKGMAHELLTAPDTGDLLDQADQDSGHLDEWPRANVREMRRIYLHAAAVPADLVEANSRAVSRAELVWREARQTSNFALLLPHLSQVLSFQRQIGQAKGEAFGLSPYDALLDRYDPGLRQATIDPLFSELSAELPDLIQEAQERQKGRPAVQPLEGPFSVDDQRRIGKQLMQAVGFDFKRGRLDASLHPFCGGSTGDVRITTRYSEGNFMSALMGVLHETGHALYEQGRPKEWRRQPVGLARGMSMHESQSLLIETQACRSREFVTYLAPLVQKAFQGEGPAWSPENLHRILTKVEPGFIRVDADEITYPAHILVRYKLEKALIAGDLQIHDLPSAFNDEVAKLLGLTVPNDSLGCLQDIHWPGGAWGYFPTYTLGAMAAAQLFRAACHADADILPGLSKGDFAPLRTWLRANVHAKGSLMTTDELLVSATGEPLAAEVFRIHLRERYLGHGWGLSYT